MSPLDLDSCLQSMRVERAELEAFKQQDECAFYSDSHALLRLEALEEDIDMICCAQACSPEAKLPRRHHL